MNPRSTGIAPTERFVAKYEVNSVGCWIWSGARNRGGYGLFRFSGRCHIASRVAYLLFRGDIPAGMQACHRCDTPACVNPDHLFLGDDQANRDDARVKGRLRGGKPKLSVEQIHLIRISVERTSDLSRQFGVSAPTIVRVRGRMRSRPQRL